jgi:hypothetical protein
MSVFQMEPNDYPHFYLIEDRRLCSMGLHCPGFSRVLYDAFICLGYDGDAPVYRCRLSRVHDLDRCKHLTPRTHGQGLSLAASPTPALR